MFPSHDTLCAASPLFLPHSPAFSQVLNNEKKQEMKNNERQQAGEGEEQQQQQQQFECDCCAFLLMIRWHISFWSALFCSAALTDCG